MKPNDICFGVELEFTAAKYSAVAASLKAASLMYPAKVSRLKVQPSSNGKYHHLKFDMSVSNEEDNTGGEIATAKFTGWSDLAAKELSTLVNVLNTNKAIFSEETGLHIHIDITGIDRMKLLALWYFYEKQLYAPLSEHRLNGGYTLLFYHRSESTKKMSAREKIAKVISDNSTSELFGNKNSAYRFYERGDRIIFENRIGEMKNDPMWVTAWIKLTLSLVLYTTKFNDVLSLFYYANTLPLHITDLCTGSLALTEHELTLLKSNRKTSYDNKKTGS